MTHNQIEYQKHLEQMRHNRAVEDETKRNNIVVSGETNRHNVVTEREVGRHNLVTEDVAKQSNIINQIHYERMDTENERRNRAVEAETNRHNMAIEYSDLLKATSSQTQAAAAASQARTASSLVGATYMQAEAAQANAATNQDVANTKYLEYLQNWDKVSAEAARDYAQVDHYKQQVTESKERTKNYESERYRNYADAAQKGTAAMKNVVEAQLHPVSVLMEAVPF